MRPTLVSHTFLLFIMIVSVLASAGPTPVFDAPIAVSTLSSTRDVAVAHVGADPSPEIIVASGNGVEVFFVPGDGRMIRMNTWPLSSDVSSLHMCDLNGDGWKDVVCGSLTTTLRWALTDALTTGINNIQSRAIGNGLIEVDSGDVNGDGKVDIVVSNYGDDNVAILLGDGQGNLAPVSYYPTQDQPWQAIVRDVTGDGVLDLLVSSVGADTLEVHRGLGDGTFTLLQSLTLGSDPRNIETIDLTGDGRLDVVVSLNAANSISVLWNNGDGTLSASPFYHSLTDQPNRLNLADIDRDTRLDILVDTYTGTWLFRNLGDGALASGIRIGGILGVSSSVPLDLNSDGRLDIIQANGPQLNALFALPNGAYPNAYEPTIGDYADRFTAADVSGDGREDVTFSRNIDTFARNLSVAIAQENGQFLTGPAVDSEDLTDVTAADVTGDGVAEIAVSYLSFTPGLRIYQANASGELSAIYTYSGSPAISIALGDLNGDGLNDIAGGGSSNHLLVWYNRGGGAFPSRSDWEVDLGSLFEPKHVAIADIDGDSRQDVVALDSDYYLSAYINDGNGGFLQQHFGDKWGVEGLDLQAADFDGNGKADLAISRYNRSPFVIMNFQRPGFQLFPGNNRGTTNTAAICAVGDFDGNGRDELAAFSSTTDNTIDIWKADGGALSRAYSIRVNGLSQGVTSGDIDGDSDLDLIAPRRPALPAYLEIVENVTNDFTDRSGLLLR